VMVLEVTETGTVNEVQVTEETLLPKVRELKERGARFITTTTRDLGDTLKVIHHFEVDDRVESICLRTPKGRPVPSITGEYLVAFIAENESQDMFGVEFKGLAVDLGGKMLKTETSPATLLKPSEGPRPPIMRKLGKCRENCPAMVDIPKYVRQVERGDVEGAYETIIDRAPLPAVLGRVCFAPCEEGCRQTLETKPIRIRMLKRYAADAFRESHGGFTRDVERRPPTGKRVAVVGGGPAGISAAYYLGMLGHEVTLLEREKALGGAMLWGIPKYRLPKDLMREEITARLKEAEVTVETGRKVTSLGDLMAEGYDACFIGIGAERCNELRCEGEDSEGVISFIDLLTAVNFRDETPDLGRRVVVIGGGNSAIDSARTAKRLGAEEVTVFYRRTEGEMPASLHEVHGAVEEGIDFDFLSTQLVIHPGRPLRIEYQYMVPGEPDESGRRRPVPMEGPPGFIEADTVVAAIGYNVVVPPGFGVEVDRKGNIVIDDDCRTSVDGVFAGGDAAFGTSNVVSAMRDARRAASSIDRYLGGEGLGEPEPDMSEFVPRQADLEEIRSRRQAEIPELDAAERVKSFVEFEETMEEHAAACEAGRCWRCDWNE